ncbi:MAG: hypothetical protein L6Q33_07840 [Bacteriovoracaceae bacterium]|nr:hypothetical protein [Bacteriovoracaceae bacterium]
MKDLKIGIITQARVGSSRLPGKTLLKIDSEALLAIHLKRILQTKYPVYLATTTEPDANQLIEIAEKLGVSSKIGSLDDVLSRYYLCAKENKLDIIVRVTSDCPLACSDLIVEGIETFQRQIDWENCYLSNTLERFYPRGMDFEIFSFKLLEWLHLNCLEMKYREHVTPFLYLKGKGDNINQVSFKHVNFDIDRSDWRLCVDELQDYDLIKELFKLGVGEIKDYKALSHFLDRNQCYKKMNSLIEQKKI